MRVTIEHHDKHEIKKEGAFRTKKEVMPGNWVKVCFQLSETEHAILTRHNLYDYVIYSEPNPEFPKFQIRMQNHYAKYGDTEKERRIGPGPEHAPPQTLDYKVRWFCNPEGFWGRPHDNPGDAKNWHAEIHKIAKKLKEFIDYNAEPGENETFEL